MAVCNPSLVYLSCTPLGVVKSAALRIPSRLSSTFYYFMNIINMSKHTNNKTSFKSRLYDSLCRKKAGKIPVLTLGVCEREQQMSNCLNCERYLRIYYCMRTKVSMDLGLQRTFIIYISVKWALMLFYMMHLQHDSDIWTLLRGCAQPGNTSSVFI
jgi:hypothetical protein